jgi:hypothetical protein
MRSRLAVELQSRSVVIRKSAFHALDNSVAAHVPHHRAQCLVSRNLGRCGCLGLGLAHVTGLGARRQQAHTIDAVVCDTKVGWESVCKTKVACSWCDDTRLL